MAEGQPMDANRPYGYDDDRVFIKHPSLPFAYYAATKIICLSFFTDFLYK